MSNQDLASVGSSLFENVVFEAYNDLKFLAGWDTDLESDIAGQVGFH